MNKHVVDGYAQSEVMNAGDKYNKLRPIDLKQHRITAFYVATLIKLLSLGL